MTPGRCARGARAAMFAAVCVLLAATGHVLMSGQDLPAAVLGPACAATFGVAWVLAGREQGLLAVTAAAVAVQTVLHTVFSWSQRQGSPPPGRPSVDTAAAAHAAMGHAGHLGMGGMDAAHGAARGTPVDSGAVAHDMTEMSEMSSSLGMLSAHLLAGLLSGLWLAYGERAAFRLARSLRLWRFRSPLRPLRLLLAAVVPVPPRRPRVRRVRAEDERAPRRLLLAHSVVSRGPPRALAVSS
ncbi:hypothetical protein ACF064_03185 [Streptomyces sp. NPDC015492]|uniref:hypothetical protein n=1 Tax=Streptomyces sp. NPDC015492 TaxID=3364958 RepID=UPI0037006F92